ncbi:hypothetical protein NLX83_21530 [Allokutzneria sp. A3M-2-11 16]|uniref:phage head completion protein n=1 Tax=Allokutzneria sp. A3M-2-11 16 TaxID=2962043 RepID=UPI0020B8309A|nr:hypothetical protein [Allokutzneria sp. A3M-2-11 16]MCP3801851.1 hypothetical protein [Allokutzneria sp. A3M-2-11 16]
MGALDHGPETVTIYPAVTTIDPDGNTITVPDEARPVVVRGCHIQPETSTVDTILGQTAEIRYRLIVRDAPLGAWAVVVWRGRRYDVLGEPRLWPHPPRLRHITATLRAGKAL